MASRPPRFIRRLTRQPQGPDPSAGAEFEAVARELERFSEGLQGRLDQRAAEQGFQAGLEAGSTGEEISGNPNSIRGRAFNEGALVAHQAAMQTDIRDSVERFELAHEADPEAFDARVDGLMGGLLEESDPRLHAFIRQRAADYSGRAKTRILARQQEQLHAQAAADLERGTEGFVTDATTAAFEGDIGLVEARRQELEQLLVRGVAGELLDPGAAKDFRATFEREVTAAEVLGNFDRTVREQGLEAGTAAIRRWQQTEPSELGLTPADHEAVTRQMITLKNREESLQADTAAKDAAIFRAEHRVRESRVDDAIEVLRKGFAPDKDQAKQVADDIEWLRTHGTAEDMLAATELAAEFDVANAIQGTVHQFRRLPEPARAAQLESLRAALTTEGAQADQVALLDALEAADAEVRQALERDPRGFLRSEALISDDPLNFESAQGLIDSLQARATDVGTQLTGGQPVPKLTAEEADQLAGVYQSAELEERVGLLGVLTAGAGEEALATLEQLDSKGHKNMALLGSFVLDGRAELARDVMRGQAVLAADSGVKPKRLDYQSFVDDAWQGALTDWPEQRSLHLEAAFAKYAELKARTGDLSDVFEADLFEQALEAVLPTADYNGRRVALPAGVTERAFEDWTESWTPETFASPVGVTPELEPLVAHGRANLAAGADFTDTAGRHTILSGSVQDSRLNDGRPTVIPFVYEGRKVSAKEAIERAVASGTDWPAADTEAEATEISKAASEAMNQFLDPEARMAVPGFTARELFDLVRSDGRLVELGHGRYGVSLDSAASGDPRFLVRGDGQPLVLAFPRGE